MAKPGTITLPDDRFVELLVNAGRSLKAGGFKTILLIGESGGNRNGMRMAADKLNELWKGSDAKAWWIDDYYTKSTPIRTSDVTEKVGVAGRSDRRPRQHPRHLRDAVRQRRSTSARTSCAGDDYENSGVSGDTVEVDARARQGVPPDQDRQRARADQGADGRHVEPRSAVRAARRAAEGGGGGGRRRPRRPRAAAAAMRRPRKLEPTMMTAPASKTPTAGARHGVHRRDHLGRNARRAEGRQDDGDRADRRDREERLSHGDSANITTSSPTPPT